MSNFQLSVTDVHSRERLIVQDIDGAFIVDKYLFHGVRAYFDSDDECVLVSFDYSRWKIFIREWDYWRGVWARSFRDLGINVEYFFGMWLSWVVWQSSWSMASKNNVYNPIIIMMLFLASVSGTFCEVDKISFAEFGLNQIT